MSLPETIDRLIAAEALPAGFAATVARYHHPLAEQIHAWRRQVTGPLVVGINGAQGTGKSTLSAFLRLLLEEQHHLDVVTLSLDDFYLTRAERGALAERVHPLLATRGVPGTHDTELALSALDRLAQASPSSITSLPVFDKALDDRLPQQEWHRYTGRPDVILFEGWCVGARPQMDDALRSPVNELETVEDPEGVWRGYVNARLAEAYQHLFAHLHRLVMLEVPDWESVYRWRLEQEEKLRARLHRQGADTGGTMGPTAVRHFIQHYERLTRHMLAEMPGRADAVMQLDRGHRVAGLTGPDLE